MKLIRVSLLLQMLLLLSCNIVDFEEPNSNTPPVEPVIAGEFLDDWTYSVNPGIVDNFDIAQFRLWVPESNENLKAILVLSEGNNTNAFGLENRPEWRDFANSKNIALLSTNFKSYTGLGHYSDARGGSGEALLKALDSIASRNNLGYIKNLPFLLRGFSAGGVFSFYFSTYKPNHVIAFANMRGGGIGINNISDIKGIPALMCIGENDAESRNERIMEAVDFSRALGGLWNYAVEPNVDHFGSLVNDDALARVFFSKALEKRLNSDSNVLIDILENIGWLGNNVSKAIFSYDNYPDSQVDASWLIDEEFANNWKDFQ
ncbi:MAG TPA: hypothetical protein VKN14_14640 [Flavobacteriaceae bacterium]|nr:hypothetical protein [Flavobacteriaceae bacterium]